MGLLSQGTQLDNPIAPPDFRLRTIINKKSKMQNNIFDPRYKAKFYRKSDLLVSPPAHIKQVAQHARALTKEAFQYYLKTPDSFDWLTQVAQDLCDTINPALQVRVCKYQVPYLSGVNDLAARAAKTLGASYDSSNLYYILLESEGHGGVGHFMSLSRRAAKGRNQASANPERRMRFFEACKFFILLSPYVALVLGRQPILSIVVAHQNPLVTIVFEK